jgi:hypothetical protein
MLNDDIQENHCRQLEDARDLLRCGQLQMIGGPG